MKKKADLSLIAYFDLHAIGNRVAESKNQSWAYSLSHSCHPGNETYLLSKSSIYKLIVRSFIRQAFLLGQYQPI